MSDARGPVGFATVVAFGSDGWGVLRADDGTEIAFHSTSIVDGSRQIPVGTRVSHIVVPGRQGRREAASVSPVVG